MSVVTLPDLEDARAWELAHNAPSKSGQCSKSWRVSPHDGTRWMLKSPLCESADGCGREVDMAIAQEALLGLSYPVARDEYEVMLQHVEDANPEWELVDSLSKYAIQHGPIAPEMWLPYAAFAIAFGIGDRHSNNALVVRHRETGEVRIVSIDHECQCPEHETWPQWLDYPSSGIDPCTRTELEDAIDKMVQSAKDSGMGGWLDYASIENVLDNAMDYFVLADDE